MRFLHEGNLFWHFILFLYRLLIISSNRRFAILVGEWKVSCSYCLIWGSLLLILVSSLRLFLVLCLIWPRYWRIATLGPGYTWLTICLIFTLWSVFLCHSRGLLWSVFRCSPWKRCSLAGVWLPLLASFCFRDRRRALLVILFRAACFIHRICGGLLYFCEAFLRAFGVLLLLGRACLWVFIFVLFPYLLAISHGYCGCVRLHRNASLGAFLSIIGLRFVILAFFDHGGLILTGLWLLGVESIGIVLSKYCCRHILSWRLDIFCCLSWWLKHLHIWMLLFCF